jgi:sulfite reductase (NADPH) flavoprotein alpha-component
LGKAVGEPFFDTVRLLHRYLLLRYYIGKSITAVATACLVLAALSGLYLRWPARPWLTETGATR